MLALLFAATLAADSPKPTELLLWPKGAPGDEEAPADAPPDQRTDAGSAGSTARSEVTGYGRTDRASMRQLIDGKR